MNYKWLRGQDSNLYAFRRLVNSQLGDQLPDLGMVPEEGVEPHLWLFRPTLLPVELSRHITNNNGAGDGNRNHVSSLENSHSAIELHLPKLELRPRFALSSPVYRTGASLSMLTEQMEPGKGIRPFLSPWQGDVQIIIRTRLVDLARIALASADCKSAILLLNEKPFTKNKWW